MENESQSKKLKEMEKELEKLKDDYEIELFWLPIREKQPPPQDHCILGRSRASVSIMI
jgi:hypothetical protein